ncbi:hypothetical protein FALCPG4_009570 [Fusarium falciforme]
MLKREKMDDKLCGPCSRGEKARGEFDPGVVRKGGTCSSIYPRHIPSLVNDGYPPQDRIFGLGLSLGFAGTAALELRDPLCDRSISQDSHWKDMMGEKRYCNPGQDVTGFLHFPRRVGNRYR